MKVKAQDIVNAERAFSELLAVKGMKASLTYKIACMARAIAAEFATIRKSQDGFVREYGKKQADGRNFKVVPEDGAAWDKFQKKVSDLMEIEIDLPTVDPITIPESVEISGRALFDLDKFITVGRVTP